MKKEEILENITLLAREGQLEKAELLEHFEKGVEDTSKNERHRDFSHILYYLGGAIVFVGIVLFVYQYWSLFNGFTKVLVTLGSGLAAFFSGVLFYEYKNWKGVGNSFHTLAALLLPFGMGVFFMVARGEVTLLSANIILFLLFAGYLAMFSLYQSKLFLLFSIIFGTLLYFAFTSYLLGFGLLTGDEAYHMALFIVLFLATSYIFFGYYFSKTSYALYSGLFYGFGSLGFLGSYFLLGDSSLGLNFWEITFPIFVFGGFFLSTVLRSRSVLLFSAIFFLAYIAKITTKYFTESVGWPLSLIFFGFVLVATGYLVFRLNQRFFRASSST